MPNTAHNATRDRLREQLERLAGGLDWRVPPAFSQAIAAFLTAMDYDDLSLMRPHLNAALEAFRDFVHEVIEKRLGRARLIREAWRGLWEELEKCPLESYDEVGKRLESILDEQLEALTDLRGG